MRKWERTTISEVADLIAGFAFKSKDFGDFQDKVVKIKDITPPTFDTINAEGVNINFYSLEKLKKYKISYGDYVLAMTGATIGKVGRYIAAQESYINQRVLKFCPHFQKCDKDFLYYTLLTPDFLPFVLNHIDSQSVQPNISASSVGKFQFRLPPLRTQQQIAKVLSSLDDKIELNAQINHNLEEQAKAIFKSWFVDFEPFDGSIPDETKEVELQSLCKIVTKGTTPTTLGFAFTSEGINFIKAESITDNHEFDIGKFSFIDDKTHEALKRSIIHQGDILFSIAGTLGRFSIVDNSILPANTNQAVAIIRPDTTVVDPYYIYSFFIGDWHQEHYRKRIQQAVQANLSLTTIKSLPILLLPPSLKQQYENMINPLFTKVMQNRKENRILIALRDALLPKLMSGEIDVSEVQV